MNSGPSVLYGWAALLVASGGSYLYVRREIDERHRIAGRAGQKDTRVLTWDERLALDAELDAAKAKVKETGAALAAATASAASSASSSTPATPAPTTEEVPHQRKSYIRG